MILHSPESSYAKERRKWEAHPSEIGPGERPWVFREYPMMMYRALSPSTTAPMEQAIAADEQEGASFHGRGFRPTPLAAIEAHEAQALEFATLAAEREHEIKYKLSEKAGAEVRAAEADYSGHMPSVPMTPLPPKSGLASWATPKKKE
jgi:hypothetical protein